MKVEEQCDIFLNMGKREKVYLVDVVVCKDTNLYMGEGRLKMIQEGCVCCIKVYIL